MFGNPTSIHPVILSPLKYCKIAVYRSRVAAPGSRGYRANRPQYPAKTVLQPCRGKAQTRSRFPITVRISIRVGVHLSEDEMEVAYAVFTTARCAAARYGLGRCTV